MINEKLLPSLPPAQVGRGFSAAPSRNSRSILSRVEGAAQRQFRRSARQVSFFDPLSVQLSLFPVSAPAQRVRY